MNWQTIESIEDLGKALALPGPIAIFKHSTRCAISSMAKSRLERNWSNDLDHIHFYYLDLIKYREVSNYIAEKFQVYHQSPQVIVIKDGKAVYNASHSSISINSIVNYT